MDVLLFAGICDQTIGLTKYHKVTNEKYGEDLPSDAPWFHYVWYLAIKASQSQAFFKRLKNAGIGQVQKISLFQRQIEILSRNQSHLKLRFLHILRIWKKEIFHQSEDWRATLYLVPYGLLRSVWPQLRKDVNSKMLKNWFPPFSQQIKKFRCKLCNQFFSESSNLCYHIGRKHMNFTDEEAKMNRNQAREHEAFQRLEGEQLPVGQKEGQV